MYGMARISISLYRRMPKIRGKYFECFAHKQISHCGYLYVVHCSHTAYYMHFIQVSSKSQKPKVLLSQMFTANNNNKHVIMNEGECVLCDQLKSPINIIMIKTIPNETVYGFTSSKYDSPYNHMVAASPYRSFYPLFIIL